MGAAPRAGARLEIQGLRHRFEGLQVLDGLSFEVRPGEIYGLLGPNGCGKSTTLRVLTGLLEPDEGQLLLDGEPVAPGGRRLRQRMGVVFQSPSLDPRLTARENLRLSAALYGLSAAEAKSRIEELLALANLESRADEAIDAFSGGMKRRLELARALLHEPALLLMDEPTTGLDERSFRSAWERIERLRDERGLTVLLTTHRADEAERCDRVAVIDGGRLIAEDSPEVLRRQVSGDILTLEVRDAEALCAELSERFQLAGRVVDGRVVLEREQGHELIPRIVESLPRGRIDSLSMHRPTLSDVFVKLTGRSLGDDAEPASIDEGVDEGASGKGETA
ncbi:MAG: ABC transporter ATP-binding protein [Myxococcales bacterium]|nr:ABC transporter ATP-binding protein [Myxococcales bacterium]